MYGFQQDTTPPRHHHHHHHHHHAHHHHHDYHNKRSPKSQESDEEDTREIMSNNLGPNRTSPPCIHPAPCTAVPAVDHITEDIDLPSCIYANSSLNALGLHHHHHISEHMSDECIHDGNTLLSMTDETYFGGTNCSPYRVQRQAANIRERKRMLRSESRTRHNSDKPPIKM